MPVTIRLTTADHGGVTAACGTDGHDCGPNCGCGCPYTGIVERGLAEPVALIEQRYPEMWLALVIPPGEDEYQPDRAMLVAYGDDPDEIWDAVGKITFNQIVHVYYNGPLEAYLTWADA